MKIKAVCEDETIWEGTPGQWRNSPNNVQALIVYFPNGYAAYFGGRDNLALRQSRTEVIVTQWDDDGKGNRTTINRRTYEQTVQHFDRELSTAALDRRKAKRLVEAKHDRINEKIFSEERPSFE